MDRSKIIDLEKNETVGRERCASTGNLEDLMKRKREGGMSRGREEEDIFRRCKKTARSPEVERREERDREEEVERWREEVEEIMRGWMDEVKKTMEGVTERIKEQERWLRRR